MERERANCLARVRDLKGAAMFLFELELCEGERQKQASRGREIFPSGNIFV